MAVIEACQQPATSQRATGPADVRAIPSGGASTELRTMVDDSDTSPASDRFRYSGHWEHVRNRSDGRSLGTSSRSFHTGDRVVISFVGTRIRVYGVRGIRGGYAAVLLDHRRSRDLANFYARTVQPDSLVYVSPILHRGPHALSLVVRGVHDPHSKGNYVNVDYAAITSATVAALNV